MGCTAKGSSSVLKIILVMEEKPFCVPKQLEGKTHPKAALSEPGMGSYWLQSFSATLTSSQSSSSEPSKQSLSPLHTRWRFRQRPKREERLWELLRLLPLPRDPHPESPHPSHFPSSPSPLFISLSSALLPPCFLLLAPTPSSGPAAGSPLKLILHVAAPVIFLKCQCGHVIPLLYILP